MADSLERSHRGDDVEDDSAADPEEGPGESEDTTYEEDEAQERLTDTYGILAADTDEDVRKQATLTAAERSEVAERQIKNGQVNEALHHYREAVRVSANDEESVSHRVTLGDAYAYSGQGLNAFRQYRRAIKTSPRKAEPHFSLGELFQRYGRLQQAIAEYRKAVQFAPENAYYRYKLGDALAHSGDLEAAVSELEETTHLKPQDGFYHFWLGDLYARAGRADESIREMQQATMFAPYDAYYGIRLGAAYRKAGMTRDAAVATRQAVRLSPDNRAYLCFLADLYSDLGFEEYAIHYYSAAGILDDYDTEALARLRRHAGIEIEEFAGLIEAMEESSLPPNPRSESE